MQLSEWRHALLLEGRTSEKIQSPWRLEVRGAYSEFKGSQSIGKEIHDFGIGEKGPSWVVSGEP